MSTWSDAHNNNKEGFPSEAAWLQIPGDVVSEKGGMTVVQPKENAFTAVQVTSPKLCMIYII